MTAAVRRIGAGGRRSDLFVAIGDQALLSLFGFALNLVLIRALDAASYGIFALWFSITLFAVSLQNAMVTTPLSVYVPGAADKDEGARREQSIATVNWGLLAVVMCAAAVAGTLLGPAWIPTGAMLLAIPAYAGATLLREFARGLAFARGRLPELAGIDGSFLALSVIGLGGAVAAGLGGAGLLGAAFLAMAVGCVAGALVGLVRFRRHGAAYWRRDWYESYRSFRNEVGWSLAGVVATHGQSRSYVYVISLLAGPESLAAMFAVGILFQPVRLVAEAWARVARPRMARLRTQQDHRAALRIVIEGALLLAGGVIALSGALMLAWPHVDRLVFGGRYEDTQALVLPWAVATLVFAVRLTVSVWLQAARAFRAIFWAVAVSAVVTIVAAAGLTLAAGIEFCLYGLAVGELVCLGLLVRTTISLSSGTGDPSATGR